MAYGTVNADVIQTSTSGGILGAGNASIMKNRIINGAMVIDQRNAGASVTASTTSAFTYTLDRWSYYATAASKFTVQQNAGSVTPPVGFSKYLGVTSSSAYSVSSTDILTINQVIEGFNIADLAWGTANAKTVTLSFQVYSSLTGTFGGALSNATSTQYYPFSYTISSANTWTTVSVTIAGSTTGTWASDNSAGIYLYIGLGVGSTKSGTAGSWGSTAVYSATGATSVVGTSGATFYITGVQLEVGSNATGFEYVNYQTSLANCQRYAVMVTCTESDGVYCRFFSGQNYSTILSEGCAFLPVKMRTYPSLTASATASHYSVFSAGSGIACSSSPILQGQGNTPLIACIRSTVASGLTTGQAMSLTANGTASAYLLYTAEL